MPQRRQLISGGRDIARMWAIFKPKIESEQQRGPDHNPCSQRGIPCSAVKNSLLAIHAKLP
jgi:hypothetical protein